MQINTSHLVGMITGVAITTGTTATTIASSHRPEYVAISMSLVALGAIVATLFITDVVVNAHNQRQLDVFCQVVAERTRPSEATISEVHRLLAEVADQNGRISKLQRAIMNATRGIAAATPTPDGGGDTGTTGPQRLTAVQ